MRLWKSEICRRRILFAKKLMLIARNVTILLKFAIKLFL